MKRTNVSLDPEAYLAERSGRLLLPPVEVDTADREAAWRELWAAAAQHARAQTRTDEDEQFDSPDWGSLPVGIGHLADWHIGSRWIDYEFLLAFAREVRAWRERHPEALRIGFLGDGTDAYLPNMGRVSGGMTEEVETDLDRQDGLFVYIMQELGGVDYLTLGCHWSWMLQFGRNPLRHIAREIGAKNMGQGYYLEATVGEQLYRIVGRHKYLGDSRLNTTNSHRRMFQEYEVPHGRRADVIARAHLHINNLQVQRYAGHETVWLSAGGAKGGDNYARQLGVKHCSGPGEFGFPIVILYPDEHRMLPFPGPLWREALAFLAAERKRYTRRR